MWLHDRTANGDTRRETRSRRPFPVTPLIVLLYTACPRAVSCQLPYCMYIKPVLTIEAYYLQCMYRRGASMQECENGTPLPPDSPRCCSRLLSVDGTVPAVSSAVNNNRQLCLPFLAELSTKQHKAGIVSRLLVHARQQQIH